MLTTPAMEGTMQAILAITNFWQQPSIVQSTANPAAPDRATRQMIQARKEQIDAARRYWACPF
jgi:hypothetical protein